MIVARPRTIPPRRRPPSPRLGRVGTQGARAAFLATGPTAWYDARDLLSASQQTLTNRVGTGTATLGSTGTSDTNDPQVLAHSGTSYVWCPGTSASNKLSTPSTAALQIADDLDVAVQVSLSDWTPGTIQTFIEKFGSYAFRVGVGGALEFVSTLPLATSTANPTVTDGQTLWVRCTRQRSSGDIKFYTAPAQASYPTSWTQLGTTISGSTAAIATNANQVTVAAGSVDGQITGALYRLRIGSTIDGAAALDINPGVETLGQASWTCTSGQTITVNRNTSGLVLAVVTRPGFILDGTDDYIQLPTAPTFTAGAGAYTVMLINRVHNLAGAATLSRVWSSESASAVGAHIYLDNANAQYVALVGGASTVTTAAAAFTATTQLHAVAAVFNAGAVSAYSTTTGLTATTDYSGVGTVTHTTPRIGSRADSVANAADLETYAVVTWSRALSATELATAATYLTGSYS